MIMDEYTSHTRCSECDGTHGDHYVGCSYDGREKRGGFGNRNYRVGSKDNRGIKSGN